MNLLLQQATEADTDFARRVHHSAYREVVERQFGPWNETQQDAFFIEDWHPLSHEIIVVGDVPVGYCAIERRHEDLHVRELVIDAEYQGRGIGTRLLEDLQAEARSVGKPIRLGTFRENRAQELYARLGFTRIGLTDTHVLMEWNLENDSVLAVAMSIEIGEATSLAEYAEVPIRFETHRALDVRATENPVRRFVLTERRLVTPIVKDYDSVPGNGPMNWPMRFDVSDWGIFAARVGGRRVGGAVAILGYPGIEMLEGRDDLAVLWDLRVAPDVRRLGIGEALLAAVEEWALVRGCRVLKVETQDINVGACRFYERHGFALRSVDRSAYPDCPNEAQLLWYKQLSRDRNDHELTTE